MPASVARTSAAIAFLSCAVLCSAGAEEIAFHDVLMIERSGRFGRSAVHTDAIEALLVNGTWAPPQAGQEVKLPDGSTRTWRAVEVGEGGRIKHAKLGGGYAFATVASDRRRPMILEASGHGVVYVNGQPRTGDPYATGYVRIPVVLEQGANQFLFSCARDEIRAKLVEPERPVLFNTADATLPDLIVGQPTDAWAAVVVINTGDTPLVDAQITAACEGTTTATPVPPIPASGVRKVGFRVVAPPMAEAGKQSAELRLLHARAENEDIDHTTIELRVRKPDESRKCTFVSEIDGSVQYYAVQPMQPEGAPPEHPALFLALHGASVEALGQANAYKGKSWGHIVAPTNRRPYGFDWEDWGRLDAIEVLNAAQAQLGTEPLHTYLTGHSMGGHGTWQVGVQFPDRFAAIAPSAGWISFWSYAGAERFAGKSPIDEILTRAANPSDTLKLSRNYLHYGVYILHGDQDDNVPVEQARMMRKHLGEYHADFAYYERPGAGHWWGNECVDWPPLFDFLKFHTKPAVSDVRHIEFVTANPAISATCDWATIEEQRACLEFSKIDVKLDAKKRVITGTTENVARLSFALGAADGPDGNPKSVLEPDQPLAVELDSQTLSDIAWPAGGRLVLERKDDQWAVVDSTSQERNAGGPHKTPQRGGPFKEAFRHHVQFVYGTRGTPAENAWAVAKARYDAETFWCRGNGSIDLVADADFRPEAEPDRNIVLYGNADTNASWKAVLGDSPVQVGRGRIQVGERKVEGDDLAVLTIYPRPGSAQALVGVVSGTGPVGMRLTERLPYFLSGVAYPDWIIISPDMLEKGAAGVRAAGFYGNTWNIDPDQSAWREPE